MPTRKHPTLPPGMIQANIQIAEVLHETMKKLRAIHHELEGVDPKLCRLYGQAVEQFLNAKPQQKLLKEFGDGTSKTSRAAGDRAARV